MESAGTAIIEEVPYLKKPKKPQNIAHSIKVLFYAWINQWIMLISEI